jgi:Transposase zinc-binding domain
MERLCPLVDSSRDAIRDELTFGGILRAFLPALLHLLKLGKHKLRVLSHLAACGTPALGANLFDCPHCRHRHWVPRSCGNRHCPRCLAAKSRQWLDKQTRSLLPVTYYHCVFTLPAELNYVVLANQHQVYPLLFDCAAQSLLEFGHNRLRGDLGHTRFECALPALLSQGRYDVRAGPSALPAEASTEPLHLLSRARSGFPTLPSLAIPTYQIRGCHPLYPIARGTFPIR